MGNGIFTQFLVQAQSTQLTVQWRYIKGRITLGMLRVRFSVLPKILAFYLLITG